MEQDKVQDIIEKATEIVRMQRPLTTDPWVCVDSREDNGGKVTEPMQRSLHRLQPHRQAADSGG